MDRILKVHFDSFRDKGLLPPELEKLNGHVKLFEDVELLKVWRNNLKGIQWADENGNIFRGAVDNLLQKDDKLIVLDYKTRGYPLKDDTASHYQDQLDIYNFLLRKNGYQTENYSYLIFYHPNCVHENGDVDFHSDLVKVGIDIKNAEKIFKGALKILKSKIPNSHEECSFCEWAESCKIIPMS